MDVINISIVIPTLNRWDSLYKTIEGIYLHSSSIANEIIIVDQSDLENDFKEKFLNFIKSLSSFTNFIILHTAVKSLTHARNLGFQRASNNIIIFSDDDVIVEQDTIKNIYELMSTKDISLIGAFDSNQVIKKNFLGVFFFRKKIFKRKQGYILKSIYGRLPEYKKEINSTSWAMGFFFSVKKDLMIKWDLTFDEKLISYAYPEDLDFTYRYCQISRKYGLKCIYSKSIRVNHFVSKEFRIPNKMNTLFLILNRYYLSYKLFPNDIISRYEVFISNIGELLRRLIKGYPVKDLIFSQFFYFKYRRLFKNGNLDRIYRLLGLKKD